MTRILYLTLGWLIGIASTIGYVQWAGQRYRDRVPHG